MDSTHIEHDLFLLMIQLSQIQDPGQIKRIFLESINVLHPDLKIDWSDTYPSGTSGVITIETARRRYGYVRVVQLPDGLSGTLYSLVRNAAAMLALILENRHHEQLLNDEKLLLTEAVAEKTASLQKSHEKLLTILDSIDANIYVADMDSHEILFMNQTMINAFGGDFVGQTCFRMFRKKSAPCRFCTNDRLTGRDGTPAGVCVWHDENPLTGRYYVNYDRAVDWIDGRLVRLQIATDITDLKMLEKKLAQAQKMESIGLLAGGIAHDFNNILFPIVGISELMLEDFPPDSPEHENIREILHAGRRGRYLVKQILSFSRQTAQEMMALKIQPVIKEVLKLCRSTIPAHIAITRHIQTESAMVMADPTQIHQVAMNLITNAFHALEDTGGTIHVQLEDRATDPRELPPGRAVVLSVSDTGCGMAPDIVDKIFDPYFTTKQKGKGTGLGLSVVHGIVKAHKGDIHVRSEVGKGTTFSVYLPVIEETEKTGPAQEKQTLPTGDAHILLVDDEKPIVMLETRILERLGYRVTAFSDSRKAMAAFQDDPGGFDLVITDMAMPHMTGAKLAGTMIAVRPDIPIIICTGNSDKINEKTAKNIGIHHFLEKPMEIAELAHAVRDTLDSVCQKDAPIKGGQR